jgi:hypothetical protein
MVKYIEKKITIRNEKNTPAHFVLVRDEYGSGSIL